MHFDRIFIDLNTDLSLTVPNMSRPEDKTSDSEDKRTEQVNGKTDEDDLVAKWGFDDWTQLYKIAVKFFKGMQMPSLKPIDPMV